MLDVSPKSSQEEGEELRKGGPENSRRSVEYKMLDVWSGYLAQGKDAWKSRLGGARML